MMRIGPRRSLSIAAAGLALLVGLPLAAVPGDAAPAAPTLACPPGQVPVQTTVRNRTTGKTITVTICRPGSSTPRPSQPGSDGNEGGGDYDPNDYTVCTPWSEANPGSEPFYKPENTPPDAVAYQCVRYINGNPVFGPYIPQWFAPGAAPLPSPQQVAGELLASVQGELNDPVLATDPVVGLPALYEVPTFVAVSNWQEGFTRNQCDPTGAICVALTATPALTFDPGDESDPVACEPGGTRFDLDGASPREQAKAEGACAYIYTKRTGVDDRPDEWPGEVTVTWSVAWEQTNGGTQQGNLADIPLTASLPRAVEDVQSVLRG